MKQFHLGVYGLIERGEEFLVVNKSRGPYKGLLDLPGGRPQHGEEPFKTLKRELKEETGYVAAQWQEVGGPLYPNPARQTNRVYSFVATDLTKAGPQSLDTTEDIEFEFVSPTEVMNRIAKGDFRHALHVACLFLAAEAAGMPGLK